MPSRNRVLASLTSALSGLLVVGLLATAPAPASAAAPGAAADEKPRPGKTYVKREPSAVFKRSSYLCMGYAACREAGYGNAGYAQASDKMYWRMYSGHNCTNYAAYRMVRSGMPNERPWSGGGNATYWGTSMASITDDTPRIGAVAWWKANHGPAGSAGHVAYVEEVVSPDEIIISQDSWGGDFSWAVVTRSSGNWPTGFVHFNDKPLTNTEAPVITGIAKVGAALTATPGSWRPSSVNISYQWFADGTPLRKADGATLQLNRARLGQRLTVRTTATQLGYPTRSAVSAPTEAVLPGQLRNTTAPTISGTVKVDSTLQVDTGTWVPEPTLDVQWYADGQAIAGATGTSLALGPDLVSRVITAEVIGRRPGYDPVRAASAPTAPVAPGTFAIVTAPHLLGTPELNEVLTVDPGVFTPADADVTVEWLRNGIPVATGADYRITNVDLGSKLSARLTLTRPGYTETSVTTPTTPRIKTDPKISVETVAKRHRLRVVVTVTASGLDEVTGPVVIRYGGTVQTVELTKGRARVTLVGLTEGVRTLTVRYDGTDAVNRGVYTRQVRIG
ncbi:CHAP domain-containing protein [Nocardioides caricicola]|uniref:CHAP domain-containing protein n=1 Tax=Nocardioides caricicola TaxID=634770 RepID=A0ABW0N0G9_9ACTN